MTLMGSYCFRRFHDKQSFPSEEGTLVLTMKVPSALRKGGNLAAHCHGGREKIVQAVSFLSYFLLTLPVLGCLLIFMVYQMFKNANAATAQETRSLRIRSCLLDGQMVISHDKMPSLSHRRNLHDKFQLFLSSLHKTREIFWYLKLMIILLNLGGSS